MKILVDELQQNFRVTTDEIGPKKQDEKILVEITAVPPPVVLKLNRRRQLFNTKKKPKPDGLEFDLSKSALEGFRSKVRRRSSVNSAFADETDITDDLENRTFTKFSLVAELARYFGGESISPFGLEDMLDGASPSFDKIVDAVNMSNAVLYDLVIPKIFHALFEIEKFEKDTEEIVELVKGYNPETNHIPSFKFKAKPDLVAGRDYPEYMTVKEKSFHLDHYCFDSLPELDFFKRVLDLQEDDKIYFTGMLVHGQSGFQVNYIHPESHTVCNYYPDFLVVRGNGETHLIEIKAQWQENDPVVLAKREAAERMAAGNEIHYTMITKEDFSGFLDGPNTWASYQRPEALELS